VRQGSCGILYCVLDAEVVIEVVKVGQRREVYCDA
jgi:mRNA-degrading endonuclease RelE of RelBE toxin-antitoxin system